MQLGTPITIISGGINAVKTVISNCNNPRIPRAHITPVITTLKVINVALNDLKKKKNMQIVTQIAIITVNWGLAIIILTIFVKLAFFRLSAASYKSMAKMRTAQPKIQSIRDQYAEDKAKQQQAMMELWKKEKINPMGGCLPMLIQMPVFIALYWVLLESVELRHAPFILWINDLSAMDPYFVLPLLMGFSMYLMQRLNPAPPDPMQAKIMQYMPIAFTFLMMWFPAGLVLYWLCNNLLSFAQQYIVTRQIEQAAR